MKKSPKKMRKSSHRRMRRSQISAPRKSLARLAPLVRMRRRHGTLPLQLPERVIHLTSDGHGRLVWALNFPVVHEEMSIYRSDDGITGWTSYDGEHASVGYRSCTGDEAYFRVAMIDWEANPLPPFSNVVFSDGL
jgi:hypothetical protein